MKCLMDALRSAFGYFVVWPLVASVNRLEFLDDLSKDSGNSAFSSEFSSSTSGLRGWVSKQYAAATRSLTKNFLPLIPPFLKPRKSSSVPRSVFHSTSSNRSNLSHYMDLAEKYPIHMSAFMQMAPDHRPLMRFTKFSRVIHMNGETPTLSADVIGWFNRRLGTLSSVGTCHLGMGRSSLFNKAYLPPKTEVLGDPVIGLKELRQAYLGYVDDFVAATCIAPIAEENSIRCTNYSLQYECVDRS